MNTIINAIAEAKEIKLNTLERYSLEDTPCFWEGDVFLSDAPLPGFASDELMVLAMNGVVPMELVRINNLDGDTWLQAINTRLETALVSVMQMCISGDVDIPIDAFPPKTHQLYDLFIVYGAMSLRVVRSEGKECILRAPTTKEAFDDATKLMTKDITGALFTFTSVVNVKKVNDETYARNGFRNDVTTRNGFGAF